MGIPPCAPGTKLKNGKCVPVKKGGGKKPPKVTDVKPGKKPGTVIITTSDGKTHVGVQGSG